jgi:hypothetical protein
LTGTPIEALLHRPSTASMSGVGPQKLMRSIHHIAALLVQYAEARGGCLPCGVAHDTAIQLWVPRAAINVVDALEAAAANEDASVLIAVVPGRDSQSYNRVFDFEAVSSLPHEYYWSWDTVRRVCLPDVVITRGTLVDLALRNAVRGFDMLAADLSVKFGH